MKIISAVLCDEVRREDTGKLIIIGAYSNDIRVERFPTQIGLSLWARLGGIDTKGKKELQLEVRIRLKERPDTAVFSGKGLLRLGEGYSSQQDVFVTFPRMPMEISRPTTLMFDVKEQGGRWQKAIEAPIMSPNN